MDAELSQVPAFRRGMSIAVLKEAFSRMTIAVNMPQKRAILAFIRQRVDFVRTNPEKVGVPIFLSGILFYTYWLLKPTIPFSPVKFGMNLPIGLHNPKNLCYLNALLQAISANTSLVASFKKSASQMPTRLLCRLVCLLEGLRCSRKYLESNNLLPVLQQAQIDLVIELQEALNWTSCDQQDVHELFGFLSESAFAHLSAASILHSSRGYLSASELVSGARLGSHHTYVHRCARKGCELTAPLQGLPSNFEIPNMQYHVTSSRVVCNKCHFRGAPVLQPEYCLTVFLDQQQPKTATSTTEQALSTVPNRPSSLSFSLPNGNTPSASASAPRKKPSVNKPRIKLEQTLDRLFNSQELISDILCPRCYHKSDLSGDDSLVEEGWIPVNKLNGPMESTCFREFRLAHLPPSLVIHVQRTDWQAGSLFGHQQYPRDSSVGFGAKRSELIRFPRLLQMHNYTLSTGENVAPSLSTEEQMFPKRVGLAKMRSYALRAVIVHEGVQMQGGHYTTYRMWQNPITRAGMAEDRLLRMREGKPHKKKSHRGWIHASDSFIRECSLEDVLGAQCYMLFYERQDTRLLTASHRLRRAREGSTSTYPYGSYISRPTSGYTGTASDDQSTSENMEQLEANFVFEAGGGSAGFALLEEDEEDDDFDEYNLRSGLFEDLSKADLIKQMCSV